MNTRTIIFLLVAIVAAVIVATTLSFYLRDRGNETATNLMSATVAVDLLKDLQDSDQPMDAEHCDAFMDMLDYVETALTSQSDGMMRELVWGLGLNSTILMDCDSLRVGHSCDEILKTWWTTYFNEKPQDRHHLLRGLVEETNRANTSGQGFKFVSDLMRRVRQASLAETLNYLEYTAHAEYPNENLSTMQKYFEGMPPIFTLEGRKLVRILQRALAPSLAFALANTDSSPLDDDDEAYYSSLYSPATIDFGGFSTPNPFQFLPKPDVASIWEDDVEFSRQFLSGNNPVMIRRCLDPQSELTSNLLVFLSDQGLNVAQLVLEERLYYASYHELNELPDNPRRRLPESYNGNFSDLDGDGIDDDILFHFHPAIVVLVKQSLGPENEGEEVLGVAAIQLSLDESARVYSRDTATDEEWMMAKIAAKNADAQFHEWVNHLGLTHLTMEPHVIAIHNVLRRKQHPLWDLLLPVTRDTFVLNGVARETLSHFGAGSIGDSISSVGTGQFMQLIRDRWEDYDFFDSSALPNELASRNFPEDFSALTDYHYMTDGMKLWTAYGTFVSDYVDEVFTTDEDVASDSVLQEWADETTDPSRGDVPGFPASFPDKATLVSALQVLMWIAGGLHAALNFGQYDHYGHVPNLPLSLEGNMEDFLANGTTSSNPRDYIFRNILPNKRDSELVMQLTATLITPTFYPINGLSEHFNTAQFGQQSYAKFLTVLESLGNDIDARNAELAQKGKPIYPYLHPSNVPASVDI